MIATDQVLLDAQDRALADRLTPGAWTNRAACRGAGLMGFEPVFGRQPDSVELAAATEAAQDFCARCPVRRQCGAWADLVGEVGLWAGSLRLEAGAAKGRFALGGAYVAVPLIPDAALSPRDIHLVTQRQREARDV